MAEYTKDDITRRVRALLAKSEQAATPEEAATFAAAAHRMMLQYNLKNYEINNKPSNIQYITMKNPGRKWYILLLQHIANTNFCKALFTSKTIYLFGEKSNVEVTQALFEYLIVELKSQATREYTAYLAEGWNTPLAGAAWKQNFYMGAAAMIGQRLHAQFQDFQGKSITPPQETFEHNVENARALVVVSNKAVEEKIEQAFGKVKVHKNYYNFRNNQDGFREGVIAGERVAINKMVGEQK